MQKKIILFFAGILLCLNVFAWQEVFALNSKQYLKVDFLDVGQGDSAFIQTPQMHQILIDGGPTSAVLEKLSQRMPFWDKDLDLIILSHPESDHMQGLLDVLKVYKADYILWSGVKKFTPEYDEWILTLEKQKKLGAKILIAKAGQELEAGEVKIDTIYPLESLENKELKNTSNDSCVVEKIIYGKNSFLFAGDISSTAEKALVNSGPARDASQGDAGGENIKSDVLKVAHHGSKYSTSDLFLAAVGPAVAAISVGAKNTYGHPTPEVLQRLEKFGIKVDRTDQQGDIKFVSDGNEIIQK